MNRLYWLDDKTLQWIVVMESSDQNEVMRKAAWLLETSRYGVVGYSKICIESKPTDYVYWTEYTRYEGGSKRASMATKYIPKVIQLLELLQ